MADALEVIPAAEFYEGKVIWSCDPNEIESGTDLYTEQQLQSAVAETKADDRYYQLYLSVLKKSPLVFDAARKILRVYGNDQPKQLDDAVLLLKAELSEYDKATTPNAKAVGLAGIIGESLTSDGLCVAVDTEKEI